MTETESRSEFEPFVGSLKYSGVRPAGINGIERIEGPVNIQRTPIVDLFLPKNNCQRHYPNLTTLAEPYYLVDRVKWRVAEFY